MYCKALDRDVLTTNMMNRFNRDALWYKINIDTPEGKALFKKYHLVGVPTTILLDSQAREVDRIIGYGKRSKWLKTLVGYMYGVDTLQDYLDRASEKPSAAVYKTVARKYLDRGAFSEAVSWAQKTRKLQPAPSGKTLADLNLVEGEAWMHTNPAKGLETLTELAKGPKSDASGEAFQVVYAYYRKALKKSATEQGKTEAQKNLLHFYHDVLPARQNDPSVLNNYAWFCYESGIELDQALKAAQHAEKLQPENTDILDTVAGLYDKLGRRDDAVKTIDRALEIKPNDTYLKKRRAEFSGGGKQKPS